MKRVLILLVFCLVGIFVAQAQAQEAWFFSEGTDLTFYDQGIVDVANLGDSDFEYTMIDGTIVKVHRSGQGAKGGLCARP